MATLTDLQTKEKITRLCELCEQLWPNEWPGKFSGRREDFRDWLNDKTDLDVDHIENKSEAIIAWINKLEQLAAS